MKLEVNMSRFWVSILIVITVLSLSLTISRIGITSGSTSDAVVAYANAFRVPLTYAAGYYGYAAGSAYATDYVDGVANDGNLTVSAKCDGMGIELSFPFDAGFGFMVTVEGDFLDGDLFCEGSGWIIARFGIDSAYHKVPEN
jgi:hypothetical protein